MLVRQFEMELELIVRSSLRNSGITTNCFLANSSSSLENYRTNNFTVQLFSSKFCVELELHVQFGPELLTNNCFLELFAPELLIEQFDASMLLFDPPPGEREPAPEFEFVRGTLN